MNASDYTVARDHFQAMCAYNAHFVAEGIAVTMHEAEWAFDGSADRVTQTAEEICLACGWDLKMFMILVDTRLHELRIEKFGECASNNCEEPADGDSHWCFECLRIEERLEREYYEGV
jgi:hypothetical protein